MDIPAPFVSSWTTFEFLSGGIFPEEDTRWRPDQKRGAPVVEPDNQNSGT
jgi:hypothetical protein